MIGKLRKAIERRLSAQDILSYAAITLQRHWSKDWGTLALRLKALLFGVEVGPGVTACGSVILGRWPGSHIRLGAGCSLISSSRRATASTLYAPVRLRTYAPTARIDLAEGVQLSGTAITARSCTISIGKDTMVGPNCVITDSDFHAHWPAETRHIEPDDVIMLLCDDNWGNVRRLPNAEERKRPGGWGMYYHVDYVGAPRNSKWLNVTPIQNMWEQLQLTYDYGVDKLWILNVGDLKPMEYPITLFLDMAWNPKRYTADNLLEHPRGFCARQFGEEQADEAARILNLYSKYNGRVTPEMLDRHTYNIETGEWKQVADEYRKLEADALRQYLSLPQEYHDAYKQLILFPVQAMANLYEMYYAQAMNHKLYKENNPQANFWADKVVQTFKFDSLLCDDYNNVMSGGKWKNMMAQKHIGYTSWNDNFRANIMPEVFRIENPERQKGGYVFTGKYGVVSMEAEHYFEANPSASADWQVIPYLGRTLSGVALMPYTGGVEGASLTYKMALPENVSEVNVHVVVKSTLAFHDVKGHEYTVGFDGGKETVVNFNADLNEESENVYSVFYPTVARRVVEKTVKLTVPPSTDGMQLLTLKPLDPGIVFEKIVVDCGGYQKSYLFMDESPCKRVLHR